MSRRVGAPGVLARAPMFGGRDARRSRATRVAGIAFVLAGLLGLCVGAAFAGERGGKGPPRSPNTPNVIQADYVFMPRSPGYITSRMVLRNPKKLRPLFLGGRGEAGALAFRPLDMERLGKIASEVSLDNLAGMAEIATATGAFSAHFDTICAAPVDLERFVGTEWLGLNPRPRFSFQVKSLTQWAVHEAKRQGQTQYKVALTGDLKVGAKSIPVAQPALITIVDASPEVKPHVILRTQFTFVGAELGLTGDDTGEIQATLMMAGYVVPATESKDLLDRVMREKEKEARDLLDKTLRDSPGGLDR